MWKYVWMPTSRWMSKWRWKNHLNYPNKELASEKTVPWILGIVLLICVHQKRPLITCNGQFATRKFRAHSELVINAFTAETKKLKLKLMLGCSSLNWQGIGGLPLWDDGNLYSSWCSGWGVAPRAHLSTLSTPKQPLLNSSYHQIGQ